MKLEILDNKAEKKGTVELPIQFNELFRPDIIKKAVMYLQNLLRTPYGTDPRAGMKYSAKVSRRRKNYRGSYGHGISRVPRKILTRRGTRFFWVGAEAPGTVGGRRAHGPKASKIWKTNINKKEKKKAIRCALSSTLDSNLAQERGHRVPENYPFVLDSSFEQINKASELKKALVSLGFEEELERTKERTIRAGKGKSRGRRFKKKTGPLLVVSGDCPLRNITSIPGVDVLKVTNLNASTLAPGTHPGRVTLFSEAALKKMSEERLFL